MIVTGLEVLEAARARIGILKTELAKLPQYQPVTHHYFHAGMYCREVWRQAGVLVVGKVHRKEHFYLIVSGTVRITDGANETVEITGPQLLLSMPGTMRAVFSLTDARCMTFHRTDATNVDDAEAELVEPDEASMYDALNVVKHKEITS